MRDAVGGTYMIRILLIFLGTYVIFIGVALNYARAFRVKNKVIDIIEQHEGVEDFNNTRDETLREIDEYMGRVSYNMSKRGYKSGSCADYITPGDDIEVYSIDNRGYCIGKMKPYQNTPYTTAEYYQVITFVDIYVPFVEYHKLIPIKGETRKIERKLS